MCPERAVARPVQLQLRGVARFPAGACANTTTLSSADALAMNTLQSPKTVVPERSSLALPEEPVLDLVLPPHALMVVTLPVVV